METGKSNVTVRKVNGRIVPLKQKPGVPMNQNQPVASETKPEVSAVVPGSNTELANKSTGNTASASEEIHRIQSVTAFNNMLELAHDLDELVVLHEIKSSYKHFQPNETIRGVYLGIFQVHGRGGKTMIPGVRWVEKGGKVFHNAGDILVDEIRKSPLLKEGDAIQITFLGQKTTNSKNTANDFEIMVIGRKK